MMRPIAQDPMGPRSLRDESPEFLTREGCQALFQKMLSMTRGGGEVEMSLVSRWSGQAHWARNRMSVATELLTMDLQFTRRIRGAQSTVRCVQVDDTGLRDAVRFAESTLRLQPESPSPAFDPYPNTPEPLASEPNLFDDATYHTGPEARAALVQAMVAPSERAGQISAGLFQVTGDGNATINTNGMFRYYRTTTVECSMTVRNAKDTASGWAGVNHTALHKIDPTAIAARALDKCLHSANPSLVEPGRYTAILEPQATADLFGALATNDMAMSRFWAERGATYFSADRPGWSKISERVLDPRLIMSEDPADPDGGYIPYERYYGAPYRPATWIDRGVLRDLAYNRYFAVSALHKQTSLNNSGSFRLSAAPGVPTRSVDEMIAATDRGLLVTRLSNMSGSDAKTLVCEGFTRDGLWLIEKGRITKAVKNFRFVESPMFVLNNLLDIGVPVRVYRPDRAWIAPAVRVRDFNFAAVSDAV